MPWTLLADVRSKLGTLSYQIQLLLPALPSRAAHHAFLQHKRGSETS